MGRLDSTSASLTEELHVVGDARRRAGAAVIYRVNCKVQIQLKAEVEVFISHIFLRIPRQRQQHARAQDARAGSVPRLCADADGLVELFLSYDADFDSFDIYRNVVISLGRVVKEPMPIQEWRKG